jgi:GntR family transcriptional repressor for pyruvate dehydrogenase complex
MGTTLLGRKIIRPPRLHQLVAQQIQEMIVAESLRPGTRLPPERVLCEKFGVSRTVIRESMRVLATRGTLKEVPGKGTFVWQDVTAPLKDLLHLAAGRGANSDFSLFEVRSLLEVEIAGLAAERATESDVQQLVRMNEELARMNRRGGAWSNEQLRCYNELEFQFHVGLAKATKNELFVVLLTALWGAFDRNWMHIHCRREMREQGVGLHTSILRAIAGKNPRAARRATRDNLRAFLKASMQAQDSEKADGAAAPDGDQAGNGHAPE